MNKHTPFLDILKQVLTEEEVKELTGQTNYTDTGNKLTVYVLLQYLAQACYLGWESFRACARQAPTNGLIPVHYSALSGKAGDVPYDVFKRVFNLIIKKCNRATRRHLNLPKDLLLIDSTTVTAPTSQLPWAPYKKFRAGIKLHVALSHGQHSPVQVEETIAKRHDAPLGEVLADRRYILVQDRAYGKIARLDHYFESKTVLCDSAERQFAPRQAA
ncbi:IS4/IS5 family transposase [Paenibacillaceae bacterium]|nr:IS4/IS5 family transposase [Paenibacillaceae bacterium]